MKELIHVCPSYETRGDVEPTSYPDAHRLTRMAVAVGQILGVSLVDAAEDAATRVGNGREDDVRYAPAEVCLLAELVETVGAQLREAIDNDYRPRGNGGALILREAMLPSKLGDGATDYDRVFEVDTSGRIGTVYPRLSVFELLEQLPTFAAFLRRASQLGIELAMVDG